MGTGALCGGGSLPRQIVNQREEMLSAPVTLKLAADGAAALSSYSSGRPDRILMDCQMPLMDGFEATRRIREVEKALGHPRLPIIAFTANAMEGDRSRSLDAGMDDHLAKPVEIDELEAVIQRWLPDRVIGQAEVA